jgi:hypothetical protein
MLGYRVNLNRLAPLSFYYDSMLKVDVDWGTAIATNI